MTDPLEQQLRQFKPTPLNGLEVMLYQAGWQAGRAAALGQAGATSKSEAAGSLGADFANIQRDAQGVIRRPWLGFISGAASGLVAASLLFVAASWNGWLSDSVQTDRIGSSDQIAVLPEVSSDKLRPAAGKPQSAETLASEQRPREVASQWDLVSQVDSSSFNLFGWFDSGADVWAQAISAPRSRVLSTAPVLGDDFSRLISVKADFPPNEAQVLDDSPNGTRTAPEFLRYQPGRSSQSGLRF